MALYKRKNSSYWWMDFEFEGRRHQASTKLRNKRAAEAYEAAYRTQLANNKVDLKPRRRSVTMGAAVADFLKWSKMQQKASTAKRYETSSKAVIRYFGAKLVAELDRSDVEKFVEWRSKERKKVPALKLAKKPNSMSRVPVKPATINRELALLRIVFNRLLDAGLVDKNPVARFGFLQEENDQFRVLDRGEVNAYVMACSQPLRDVAILMLETGMRPSEIYGLRTADVDLQQNTLQISAGKTKSARRKIPLSTLAAETLRIRLASARGEYVFGGGKKGEAEKPIVKLTNAHLGAVRRAKLRPFRLYDLRHTFATRACEAGVDLVTVKDLLGHSRLDMVLRYSHPTEAHRADAMRKIELYKKTA